MTKFLLDSGDPNEYKEIAHLAEKKGSVLWGSTTNPSLIAKKIAASGKKLTSQEAFSLQKEIVLEIVDIVPGAVSAEVYADHTTPAEDMIRQGRDIASWHSRVVVKLPTTLEGFKARTVLRKEGIGINNTLVFSQQQVFAIALHENIMRREYGVAKTGFPGFISPFVGRLDDRGENGLAMLQHALQLVRNTFPKDTVWMLEASVRNLQHLKVGIDLETELMTVPANIYREWFALTTKEQETISIDSTKPPTTIPVWTPPEEMKYITTVKELMRIMENGQLDITHPLTTAGIEKFVADWKMLLQ